MYKLKLQNEIENLRQDIVNRNKPSESMERQYAGISKSKLVGTGKNINSAGVVCIQPKLKGHVSVEKPSSKFDSMDMTVHLTLRSDKKPRSRSLSRPDTIMKEQQPSKNTNQQRKIESSGRGITYHERQNKNWNDILKSDIKAPPMVTHKTKIRHRSASPKRVLENNFDGNCKFQSEGKQSYSASDPKRNQTSDVKFLNDLNAFSLFNPVRTLQFLICELRNTIKPQGEQVNSILTTTEQLLAQMPQNSPVFQASTAEIQPKVSSSTQASQPSRTAYETMRRDRDNLQLQLNEKERSHLSLVRKTSTLEAKLTRERAKCGELQVANERLVAEQHAMLAALQAQDKGSEPKALTRVQEELAAANGYIAHLKTSTHLIEQQYCSKMKVVQDILHDGFDFTKNDSVRLSEVLGQLPEELSALELGFEPRAANFASESSAPTHALLEEPAPQFSIEQYINTLMQQSGLLKDEQFSIFRSFHSIPESSPDKKTDSH